MSDYNFQNLRNTSDDGNKRLFITIIVSMLFLTIWNIFTAPNEEELKKRQEAIKTEKIEKIDTDIQKVNNSSNQQTPKR